MLHGHALSELGKFLPLNNFRSSSNSASRRPSMMLSKPDKDIIKTLMMINRHNIVVKMAHVATKSDTTF